MYMLTQAAGLTTRHKSSFNSTFGLLLKGVYLLIKLTIAIEGTRCAALGRCLCSGPKMQHRPRCPLCCIFGPGSIA